MAVVASCVIGGCARTEEGAAGVRDLYPPPNGRVVVSQVLTYADGESDWVGSGFFVRSARGRIVGVTALHLVDLEGLALERVDWVTAMLDEIGSTVVSFGPPGREIDERKSDYASDFVLLLKTGEAPMAVEPLEMDDREVARGEPVWIASEDLSGDLDVRWVGGTVVAAEAQGIVVALDAPESDLNGMSGSPLVSRLTGKVVGILSAAGEIGGVMHAIASPIGPAREAVLAADRLDSWPKLVEIDWGSHRRE